MGGGIRLQDGRVGSVLVPDGKDLRRHPVAFAQRDVDVGASLDHMCVCQHVARLINDHSLSHLRLRSGPPSLGSRTKQRNRLRLSKGTLAR